MATSVLWYRNNECHKQSMEAESMAEEKMLQAGEHEWRPEAMEKN